MAEKKKMEDSLKEGVLMEKTCLPIKALGTPTFGACGEEKEEMEKSEMLCE